MNESDVLPTILPFLDAGLYPFARCERCEELMPMNLGEGPFGTVLVTCCRCKSPASVRLIRFLTSKEAASAGWLFEEAGNAGPLN
jgi:hypothetical protein